MEEESRRRVFALVQQIVIQPYGVAEVGTLGRYLAVGLKGGVVLFCAVVRTTIIGMCNPPFY